MEDTTVTDVSCFASDFTDLVHQYKEYDKPTLIEILLRKDEQIQRTTDIVAQLQTEVNRLKENNAKLNEEVTKLRSENGTKVYASDLEEEDIDGKPMPDWSSSINDDLSFSISDAVRATAEAELKNIEPEHDSGVVDSGVLNDSLPAGTDSEYVFDSSSGFYYHPATGYYWDPNSGLFYDYTTYTYYQYNETSGAYEVHSQVNAKTDNIKAENTQETKHLISSLNKSSYAKTLSTLKTRGSSRKKIRRKRLSRKRKKLPFDQNYSNEQVKRENDESINLQQMLVKKENDSQELSASDSESSGSLATDESELISDPESGEIISSSSSSSDVEMIGVEMAFQPVQEYSSEQKLYEEAIVDNYPPCIRLIVQESEELCVGTLFIITCAGGTIGRGATKKHSVEIPDIGVSKSHARIEYDYDDSCYKVTDLGSQNGSKVNGSRVLQDDRQPLLHGDVLELGLTTKLLLHIHNGHETCDDCEPGQVQAKLKASNTVRNAHVVMTKEDKMQNRRKELRNIRKKYGLQNSHYANEGAVVNDKDYADKAYLRRKYIGSENDHARPQNQPASVHCPIESSNKGRRLLAKMGWKEGQGLGKANAGISEPITVEMRVNQASGLGSGQGNSLSLDQVQESRRAERWGKARQRFHQLQQSQPPPPISTRQASPIFKPLVYPTPADPDDAAVVTTDSSLRSSTVLPVNIQPAPTEDNSCSTFTKHELSPSPPSISLSLPTSSLLLSSSSSSASSGSSSSLVPKTSSASTKPKPQMKWHKGGTETLSSYGFSENKDL